MILIGLVIIIGVLIVLASATHPAEMLPVRTTASRRAGSPAPWTQER